jgi:predicted transcriptional regulator
MKTQTIEVDEVTAAKLKTRAAEQGLSVSELVAEMAILTAPIVISSAATAELDRQWAAIKAGEPTLPHEDVAQWLQTWGTPAFKPWHER